MTDYTGVVVCAHLGSNGFWPGSEMTAHQPIHRVAIPIISPVANWRSERQADIKPTDLTFHYVTLHHAWHETRPAEDRCVVLAYQIWACELDSNTDIKRVLAERRAARLRVIA